ncbi:unnamed protein product [Phytophthora lilii]|uniref:Unnamed protein product n=1 Tax=Phytophthora lilii TaxID=2077276 RepID=A0A9W6TK74_9STRA|nr:unnamed protein product [Phytophthora lilii]
MADNNPPAFIPLIPGMRSTHYEQMTKTHFRRGQLLERMSMGKLTSSEKLPPPPAPAFNSTSAKSQELRPTTTTQATYTAPPQPEVNRLNLPSTKYRVDSTQPAWLTHDRLVLRFFAYFIDPVELADGRTEQRVRRVVVCFYLSDRSISISEPRVVNSGIPQGEFMRRTVVRKGIHRSSSLPREHILEDFYSPEDFRIGGELRLYGRTFHIVDCDAATRSFYSESLGERLESPRIYPDEPSSKMDEVDELKSQLRVRTRALGASKAEATRKFHDLSQKVLRFYASWHDDHPLYPETRRFVLHYYLCDDTVEVVEARDSSRERGRGHFSVLLSRRKLAREPRAGTRQQNDDDEASYFITDRDLRCGEWVDVFSRRLLLEDCDAFTREYYLETHGVTQEKFEPPSPETPETAAKWRLFQAAPARQPLSISNGRGTSGYSANNNNSCMQSGLVAPIPGGQSCERNSMTQLCRDDDLDGKQLRFRARFQGLPSTDINSQREFVLTYFLEDETLAVFEPRVRNSGVLGGRFLDRARFRKYDHSLNSKEDDAPAHYQASDMYVGAILSFEFSPHQRLELVEADSQTLSFCESHPEVFRFSDSSAVLSLAAKLWMKGPRRINLRREWRQLDANSSHSVSMESMKNVLTRSGIASSMNEQQIITLFRRFVNDDNNQSQEHLFAYDEFCDILSALVSKPLSSEEHEDAACSMCYKMKKIPRVRRLLTFAGSNHAQVSLSELLKVANDRSVALSKAEIEVLTTRFASSNGKIDIYRLCDYVFDLPSNCPETVDSEDITISLNFANNGDEALPPASGSTERSAQRTDTIYSPPQSARKTLESKQNLQSSADHRVVNLLHRVFGARKYQLRKALRDRDAEKNGRLREDDFMDALLHVAPQLSDEDSYLIADAFFPTNNCYVDYPVLLESAFRN